VWWAIQVQFARRPIYSSTSPFRPATRRSSGFTLVELLIVIITIALLASLSITAVFRAQNSAKEAKTKVLITKLHEAISGHMSTYSTRRLPIDVWGYEPDLAAEFKLQALRQLMRLEMPDSWQDVYAGRVNINLSNSTTVTAGNLYLPAMASAYQSYRESINVQLGSYPSNNFQNAECLYMIVTIGLSDRTEGLKIFSDDQIADTDNDGANEFVDAWGIPISFIRWPVGFVDDPRQDASSELPFGHLSDLQPSKQAQGVALPLVECRCDQRTQHDPHDPRVVDPFAYFVFPLIYSAGLDKQYDIYSGSSTVSATEIDDPFAEVCTANESGGAFAVGDRWVLSAAQDVSGSLECSAYNPVSDSPLLTGIPMDLDDPLGSNGSADGALNHYDNIHNHMLTTRLGE
ncbi:MAG: type II secretion system GspH family protein, partial [Planctomycetales bacterium]